MKFLFTRRNYVTKNKVTLTPAYHLYRGTLLKTMETTEERTLPVPYKEINPRVVLRFPEKERMIYMEQFDWYDVENCDQEVLEFVRDLKDCSNIWKTALPWPFGREKLLEVIPWLAGSNNGNSLFKALYAWNHYELPMWAKQKSVEDSMIKKIDKLVGLNYTRAAVIQAGVMKVLRERLVRK